MWRIRPDELPAFLEGVGWSSNDPDPHDENQGQGVEYHHVALKSEHSAAGSNQRMEPGPETPNPDPAATANDE